MASSNDLAHIKVLNTTGQGKNRLRFASSRKRSAEASADVYRNFKRQSVVRETAVHHHRSNTNEEVSFRDELDVCLDRNASEVFRSFYKAVWPYCRSLPELLHHKDTVVTIVLEYMKAGNIHHGTLDILHLIAVLAKQLRHELIHDQHVHSQLVPTLFQLVTNDTVDVSYVEAAFRTVAYILQYTATTKSSNDHNPLDALRSYYGTTITHSRPLVRRLAAETLAPVVRRHHHTKSRQRHVKKVLQVIGKQAQPQHQHVVDGVATWCAHVAMHKETLGMVLDTLLVMAAEQQQQQQDTTTNIYMLVAKRMLEVWNASKHHHKWMQAAWQHLLTSSSSAKHHYNIALQWLEPHVGRSSSAHDTALRSVVQHSLEESSALVSSPALRVWMAVVVGPQKQNQNNNTTIDSWIALMEPHWTADVAHCVLAQCRENNNTKVVTAILSHASSSDLTTLHAVAAATVCQQQQHGLYNIPVSAQERLQNYCWTLYQESASTRTIAQRVAILKALTLTAAVSTAPQQRQRVMKELVHAFLTTTTTSTNDDSYNVLWATALGCITSCLEMGATTTKTTNQSRVATVVREKLLQHPDSPLVVQSVAGFVQQQASDCEVVLFPDADAVLDALIPNLRSPCHLLRLHSLQILVTLPKRPFVVDHATVDWTDDLDEEMDSRPMNDDDDERRSGGPGGLCHFLDTLLQIESTRPTVQNERSIAMLMTSIVGRAGGAQLPVAYAEAATNHLLGTLWIKFSPLWSTAIDTLVKLTSTTNGQANVVVPIFQQHMADVMNVIPYQHQQSTNGEDGTVQEEDELRDLSITKNYEDTVAWESSKGMDVRLFRAKVKQLEDEGAVSPFHAADNLSVCESLWKIAEGAPLLMTRQSEQFVPIFLRFISSQYYAFNLNDPDARELSLEDHFSSQEGSMDEERSLDSKAVHRRLHSCLKGFAAVSRPSGLYKHEVLLSIFTVFVSHQDVPIAKTAFSCLAKFRLPYISPYVELLSAFYDKGKLRDAMMNLKDASENETILVDHRKEMSAVLARILYGRLGSNATSAKSSKDSPQARRHAVLSFLSSFTKEEEELYPFIYLMMRAYLPADFESKPLEKQTLEDGQLFLATVAQVSVERCAHLPIQVNQGFLNALEAVISQLGQRVVKAVPAFLGVVLGILKAFEISGSSADSEDMDDGDKNEDNDNRNDSSAATRNSRSGSIRSLCYRRIGDVFGNYSAACPLSAYHAEFWNAADKSLVLLPQMATSSTRVPALLGLMKSISQLEGMVNILADHADCIPSVLRCLSPQSRPAIVDAILVIIDGLLTCGESTETKNLLKPHTSLLLEQFRLRLESKNRVSTWRSELDILCRVSKVVEKDHGQTTASTIEKLCFLLVPFLDPNGFGGDQEKHQVIEILLSLVDKISAKCAEEIFLSLSLFLGICKGKQGLQSQKIRSCLAAVISKLSQTTYPAIRAVGEVTSKLCSVNQRKLNEINFDVVLSCLASLSSDDNDDQSWGAICDGLDPVVLQPVVACCFHYLFEDDGVVSRASFKAIRFLLSISCSHVLNKADGSEKWKRLLEGKIVPVVRGGLLAHSETVRRFFVLLVRDLVVNGKEIESDHLHRDLICLVRDDEPDLDFFHNITHVQVHRRARALQRLRKTVAIRDEEDKCCPSPFSVCHVLLPLATHSVYETKTNIEETYALEGMATAGALTRHLPWSKYSSTLSTHLNQFERHVDQEKYLVGLICSMIDAFHFDVGESPDETNNSVRKALEKRLIPMIERMLTKENKANRKGKLLRPAIALALLKLIQKLPKPVFEERLQRLLVVICDVLGGRDSTARETARSTLGKMVVAMDISYVSDVIRELAIALSEGFRVHVRTAAVHAILLQLSAHHTPQLSQDSIQTQPAFDKSVPGFVDLIQRDLFGVAQERKDAKESNVRFVQEAQGSKSAHCLELLAAMIQFRPFGNDREARGASASVKALVTPFLERLNAPSVAPKIAGRVRDCLTRIVAGLQKNPSLTITDVLLFVKANLVPFIKQSEIDSVASAMYREESDDEDPSTQPLMVSGSGAGAGQGDTVPQTTKGSITRWQPSLLEVATTAAEANDKKSSEAAMVSRVQDGASAPKLTGSNRSRHVLEDSLQKSVNSPQSVRAITFCLSLLNRKLKSEVKEAPVSILEPFVPLLTTCACCCRDTEASMLALKCLAWLLQTNLTSLRRCSKALATKTLDLMVSSAGDEEQRQLAFKMLTSLLYFDRKNSQYDEQETQAASIPLTADQMQVLLSYIKESVQRGDQYSQAINLLKSVMSRKYISADLYDLMEVLLRQSVQGSKANLRQQCGNLFQSFLINYPLSPERVEQHVKQVVANLQYKEVAGRLSAAQLTTSLIEKLPIELVEKFCQLFFFPLTVQLANDESKECKEAITVTISRLFRRLPAEALQPLYDYSKRWSGCDQSLQRTALQLFRLLAESRPDFTKKRLPFLLELVNRLTEPDGEWETVYLCVLLIEKLAENCSRAKVDQDRDLWASVLAALQAQQHPWVQLACCRLISSHLFQMDPQSLLSEHPTSFLADRGSSHLFNLGKAICALLDKVSVEAEDLIALAIKCLVWTLSAMKAHPRLCGSQEDQDSVRWVLARLCAMAKPKGETRQVVFKCFAAFVAKCFDCVSESLELLIEPLYRVEVETRNHQTSSNSFSAAATQEDISDETKLAKDVMFLLEEQCSATDDELFLKALNTVKKQATERKDQRRALAKAEAVTDPQRFAQRRVEKQGRERQRRKRRVEERRQERGAKRKHRDTS